MQVFKTGKYVTDRFHNPMLSSKEEQVVVIENCHEYDCIGGFLKLREYVNSFSSILKEDAASMNITTNNGVIYQLANERRYSSRYHIILSNPSSIIGHMSSRDFRFENLYLDDKNDIIDISGNAIRDIENRRLHLQNSNLYGICNDITSVLKIITLHILDKFRFGDNNLINEFRDIDFGNLNIVKTDNDIFKEVFLPNTRASLEFLSKNRTLLNWFLAHDVELNISITEQLRPQTKQKLSILGQPYVPIQNNTENVTPRFNLADFTFVPTGANPAQQELQRTINYTEAAIRDLDGLDELMARELGNNRNLAQNIS